MAIFLPRRSHSLLPYGRSITSMIKNNKSTRVQWESPEQVTQMQICMTLVTPRATRFSDHTIQHGPCLVQQTPNWNQRKLGTTHQAFSPSILHQQKVPKSATYLFTIVLKEKECLREFVQRFTRAINEILHVNHDLLA